MHLKANPSPRIATLVLQPKNNDRMGLFSSLFRGKRCTPKEEYKQKKPNLRIVSEEDTLEQQASNAMSNGEFEQSVELYLELACKYPLRKGLYLSRVGAAYYFLTEFDKAIAYYLEAKQQGMDEVLMDANVWKACSTQYNNTHDIMDIKKYLEYFPEGKYTKKAQKLLNK